MDIIIVNSFGEVFSLNSSRISSVVVGDERDHIYEEVGLAYRYVDDVIELGVPELARSHLDALSLVLADDHLLDLVRHLAQEGSGLAGLYMNKGFSAASRRLNNYFAFSCIGTDTGDKHKDPAERKKKQKRLKNL